MEARRQHPARDTGKLRRMASRICMGVVAARIAWHVIGGMGSRSICPALGCGTRPLFSPTSDSDVGTTRKLVLDKNCRKFVMSGGFENGYPQSDNSGLRAGKYCTVLTETRSVKYTLNPASLMSVFSIHQIRIEYPGRVEYVIVHPEDFIEFYGFRFVFVYCNVVSQHYYGYQNL